MALMVLSILGYQRLIAPTFAVRTQVEALKSQLETLKSQQRSLSLGANKAREVTQPDHLLNQLFGTLKPGETLHPEYQIKRSLPGKPQGFEITWKYRGDYSSCMRTLQQIERIQARKRISKVRFEKKSDQLLITLDISLLP